MILRQAGLRKESLPFDWILGNPEHLKRSMEVNFSDWFDDNIEVIRDQGEYDDIINENTNTKYITRHPNYPVEIAQKAIFAHMDFSDPEVVASVKKRIDRFNEIRASNENIVLVTSIPYAQIISYGLLDYFNKDRQIKIVTIEHVQREPKKVKCANYKDYYKLKYSSSYSHDLDAMNKVGEFIKSLNL